MGDESRVSRDENELQDKLMKGRALIFWLLAWCAHGFCDVAVQDTLTGTDVITDAIYSAGKESGQITVSGTDRMLVLLCSYWDAMSGPISSATFNSVSPASFTQYGSPYCNSASDCTEIWYTTESDEPPAETATITVRSIAGISAAVCGAIALDGVDIDGTPLDARVNADGTSTQSSVTVTSESGDLVLALHKEYNKSVSAVSGTTIHNTDDGGEYGIAHYDTGTSVDMDVDYSASVAWAASGVNINASGGASDPSAAMVRRRGR